jgi:hypothetical protein
MATGDSPGWLPASPVASAVHGIQPTLPHSLTSGSACAVQPVPASIGAAVVLLVQPRLQNTRVRINIDYTAPRGGSVSMPVLLPLLLLLLRRAHRVGVVSAGPLRATILGEAKEAMTGAGPHGCRRCGGRRVGVEGR